MLDAPKRVLLLSWTLPPVTSGSAVIVGNLAKQFDSSEMIVVGERSTGYPPVRWESSWPRRYDCSVDVPPGWRGSRWFRRAQLPSMLSRALYLARRHRCTSVLAVFPNEEYLCVGYTVARLLGLEFFPYFHNTYLENRKGNARRIAEQLQERVFASAKHVFVMSDGMAELYRERYPGLDCSALVHSFNEPIPVSDDLPTPGATLRIAILGNINESCREATQRFMSTLRGTRGWSVTFITGVPRAMLASMGLMTEGVERATVSRDEVVPLLREFDVVFLPHGFSGGQSQEEYDTIFPTRTIEYLICGRPILAHVPPQSFLCRFLKQNDCALVVDRPEPEALRSALGQLRNDTELRNRLVGNAMRAARQFHAPVVAANLRERLAMR